MTVAEKQGQAARKGDTQSFSDHDAKVKITILHSSEHTFGYILLKLVSTQKKSTFIANEEN